MLLKTPIELPAQPARCTATPNR